MITEIPLESEFNENVLHGHSSLFFDENNVKNFVAQHGFEIIKSDTNILTNSLFLLKKNKNKKD